MIRGISASPGIAIGRAIVVKKEDPIIKGFNIQNRNVDREIARFKKAVQDARKELSGVSKRVKNEIGITQAHIFDAHIYLLEDPLLIDKTIEYIRREKKNAELALTSIVEDIVENFNNLKDAYIRERAIDIHDVSRRILNHLSPVKNRISRAPSEPVLLVAENFAPSDVVQMKNNQVCGFITEQGARTSHAAIIARALKIPAVVGVENIRNRIKTGDKVIIDGTEGEAIVTVTPSAVRRYLKRKSRYDKLEQELLRLRDLPVMTEDGKTVELSANAELPIEVETIGTDLGCPIGLYRTEYMFLNRKKLPSEEEQFQALKLICKKMESNYVVIRTMDLGADKPPSYISFRPEMNPFMGWRAVRLNLARTAMFGAHLRAVLRASVFGNVKIMFPMITSLEEYRLVRDELEKAKRVLKEKKIEFNPDIEVGIMIETPGAVMIADHLAKEVDFFSIGTNDLIQFTLAVDRGNEQVSHLYNPHHPALLRLIKHTVDAAHRNDIWIGVCGEMASNPYTAAVLLGIGVDELSVNPSAVLGIKRFVRSIQFHEMNELSKQVLRMETANDINRYLHETFNKKLLSMNLESYVPKQVTL